MTTTDLLGYVAGALTTVAFVPQLLRTYRTKSARDISWGMMSIFCIGVLFWLIYGIFLGALPVIASNGVTLLLAVSILVLKARYT